MQSDNGVVPGLTAFHARERARPATAETELGNG
jgi:hypothetical protein